MKKKKAAITQDLIHDIRVLAEKLRILADNLEENITESMDAIEAALPKEAEVQEQAVTVSLETVRGRLAELCREGYTAEVQELLAKHEAKRLSDLPPELYPELLGEAEQIGCKK